MTAIMPPQQTREYGEYEIGFPHPYIGYRTDDWWQSRGIEPAFYLFFNPLQLIINFATVYIVVLPISAATKWLIKSIKRLTQK